MTTVCTRPRALIKSLNSATSRIWTIPAIHGDLGRLISLHNAIYEQFKCGDQLIYHGNYIGHGINSAACIDEILTFRRIVLSIPGVRPDDFTYLKGSQEDLWHRLLQLSFTPNPIDSYLWMLANGTAETLSSYGICHHDGMEACRFGTVGLTRWTNAIRDKVRNHAGHEYFFANLRRAATTNTDTPYQMLFVHAGIDHAKQLSDQGNAFYWGDQTFHTMNTSYSPFEKVVRGFDPLHNGANFNCIKATIDNGCGFGGDLMSACFAPNGEIEAVLNA